jgi:hypothetical protein
MFPMSPMSPTCPFSVVLSSSLCCALCSLVLLPFSHITIFSSVLSQTTSICVAFMCEIKVSHPYKNQVKLQFGAAKHWGQQPDATDGGGSQILRAAASRDRRGRQPNTEGSSQPRQTEAAAKHWGQQPAATDGGGSQTLRAADSRERRRRQPNTEGSSQSRQTGAVAKHWGQQPVATDGGRQPNTEGSRQLRDTEAAAERWRGMAGLPLFMEAIIQNDPLTHVTDALSHTDSNPPGFR